MPWLIEIKGDKLVLRERRGGTRGTNYFYVLNSHQKRLIHVSQLNHLFSSTLENTVRAGRQKDYKYEASLRALEKELGSEVILFMFWYSNKGYGPDAVKYLVSCSRKTIESEKIDVASIATYEFEALGSEEAWIKLYKEYVPKMVNTVKNVANKLGVTVLFTGHAVRLENLYKNPRLGYINALVQPSWRSRQKALEAYVRSAHELYVMSLIVDALDAKTIYHIYNDSGLYWQIEYASNIPTAIIETPTGRKHTIWFQFSLKEWWDVVREKWINAMLDKPREQLPSSRQYVRPDIVIIEGVYQYRDDLKDAISPLVVLIDAKISFGEADFKQLEGYVKNFGEMFGKKVIYIVASLGKILPYYRRMLEKIGYYVIEEVAPEKKGEKEFQDIIRRLLL